MSHGEGPSGGEQDEVEYVLEEMDPAKDFRFEGYIAIGADLGEIKHQKCHLAICFEDDTRWEDTYVVNRPWQVLPDELTDVLTTMYVFRHKVYPLTVVPEDLRERSRYLRRLCVRVFGERFLKESWHEVSPVTSFMPCPPSKNGDGLTTYDFGHMTLTTRDICT